MRYSKIGHRRYGLARPAQHKDEKKKELIENEQFIKIEHENAGNLLQV